MSIKALPSISQLILLV